MYLTGQERFAGGNENDGWWPVTFTSVFKVETTFQTGPECAGEWHTTEASYDPLELT